MSKKRHSSSQRTVNKVSRRDAIRSIYIGAAGISLAGSLPGLVKANDSYDGVVYDPVTHEVHGDASMHLQENQDQLVTVLRYGDNKINIDNAPKISEERISQDRIDTSLGKYRHVGSENQPDGREITENAVIKRTNGSLTGYIDRDKEDRIAFAVSNKVSSEDLQNFVEVTGPDQIRVEEHEPEERTNVTTSSTSGDLFEPVQGATVVDYDEDLSDGTYTYTCALAANDESSLHNHTEVPANGANRWSIQAYFTDPPEGDGSIITPIVANPDSAEFKIENQGGYDPNITFAQEYPQDDASSYNFFVEFSAGIGPFNAGISRSETGTNVDLTDPAHQYSDWWMDQSNTNWPEDQDESAGVEFNISALSTLGTYQLNWETKYGITYLVGDSPVHSEVEYGPNSFEIDVVQT